VHGLPPSIRLAPLTPLTPPTYLEWPLASTNGLANHDILEPVDSSGPKLHAK